MAADVLQYIGTAFDRLVSVFNPDRALSRHRARQLLARAYEGASKRDGWKPRRAGASANADHGADATELRTRARALFQNVPYMAQGLRSLVSAVIGTGFVPRWKDEKLNALWKEWGPVCDADGRLDIYGIEALGYEAAERDGEVLVRLRWRRPEDGLPVPLQLQVLEIDWLDSSKTMPNGSEQIINGVQYDVLGKVSGYWLFDQHPGEMSASMRGRAPSRFVPASSVIHYYRKERPGQGRGFPRAAPIIARVRDTQLYEDAELQRKNLETRLSVMVSGTATDLANPPSPNEAVDTEAAKGGDLGPLQSGGIMQLPPGMNIEAIEPKAAGGYVEYMKYQLHLIAAGFGVTYAMLTGDTSEASWTSERASRLNFQTQAERERWTQFIPSFLAPICKAFADAAELAGKVQKASYDIEYSTPKWNYVNPKDDVDADVAEIAGGLSSFSEKLRQRGYKPDEVFAELDSDIKKLRASGVLDVLLKMQKGKQLEPQENDPAA